MVEEFGGIFLLKEVLISTLFPESASDLFFFIWKEKNLEKSPGFLPQKSSAADFFFLGDFWDQQLRSIVPLLAEESLKKPERFFFSRSFEFWVLSFDFLLFLFYLPKKRLS